MTPTPGVRCARMTRATLGAARALLGEFLAADEHYRASAGAYGDAGPAALDRALELFLARPELGFVWLAFATGAEGRPEAAGRLRRLPRDLHGAGIARGEARRRDGCAPLARPGRRDRDDRDPRA